MVLLALLACGEPSDAGATFADDAPTVTVRTLDGATIALHRHGGDGAPPVLLVHGISSNHRFWDLDGERSLARWLAARGWDAWVLDLRGHGDALPHVGEGAGEWSVDDYGMRDAAAAVAHVQQVTGYRTVAWVGHSMGGMVGGTYLASGGAANVAAFVPVASPARFDKDAPLMGLARSGLSAGGWVSTFDTRTFAEMSASLGSWDVSGVRERLYNPANLPAEQVPSVLRGIVSPLWGGEMAHFGRMIRNERYESADGRTDWAAALRAVTVPTLAFTGGADQIVPPESAGAWAGLMGGPVEVVHCDTAHGVVADYGHLDFGVGVRAATEVWTPLEAFLRRHPPTR